MINAIIMASGFSRRMGKNKLILKYKDGILAESVFKVVDNMGFNEVLVVTQYDEIATLSKKYRFNHVLNYNSEMGQSESIKLGLNNSSDADGYMFFVADQPFLDEIYLKKMIYEFLDDPSSIIIPRSTEKTGNPVIFPRDKKSDLLKLTGDEKGKKVISDSSNIKYIEVPEKMLFDIDTIDDYKELGGNGNETN